jgi:hypothetical protein
MKFFLCALAVACCLSIRAASLDREAFTFTKYDLNVRIEPEQQRLGVRGKIVLRNDSDIPQQNLSLQISSTLNWSSIQIEGKPATFLSQAYTSDIDHTGALTEAIITLPKAIAPKQTIELEIGYEGIIPQDTARLTRIGVPADVAKHSDWDQIEPSFAAMRGVGYVAWYPIATVAASLSEGNSVFETVGRWKEREPQAEMKIIVSSSRSGTENPPQVVCGGEQIDRGTMEPGPGKSATIECSYGAIGRAVPSFAIGNYSVVDRENISIHFLSDHKSRAENYALAAEQASPFVNKWFGDHREKSDVKAQVVEIPDSSAAPFESGNILLMPLTEKDTGPLLSAIQQLTHLVFPSPREWICDGLASYAQARYVQEEEGRDAAIAYLKHHRDSLIQAEKQAATGDRNKAAANSLINSPDEFYVQAKAMNVWWMLRDMIGEDALTAALHNYKAADDKDASYMQKLIRAQAHRDLEWFFDDWVYRDRGLPDFHIVSVYPRQLLSGGYMVTVTVENLGDAAAEVPVTLHMEKAEASEQLVVPGKSRASVRIQAATLPQTITVNDGGVPESDVTNNTYRLESVPQP